MAENNLIETGRCVYSKGHVAGAWSGSLTGLAANTIVYAVRNVGPAELIVDSVDLAFATETPSSTGSGIAFGLHKVPLTVLSGTGARATPPVIVRKRTTDHKQLFAANPPGDPGAGFDTNVIVHISNTGALTAVTIPGGIALFQDDPQGVFSPVPVNNGAANALLFGGSYRWEPRNGIPLTLAPDEGLIVVNKLAFPTALVGRLFASPDLRVA